MVHRVGLDRTRVVEEATKLVDEEGLEQLSLGRLAERLGVRTPSLYNHVSGLTGLKNDLALYCTREATRKITQAVLGKSGAEAVYAFARAYRDFARETPGRYALTVQAPDPEDEARQASAQDLLRISYAILAPYKLNEVEATNAVRGLRSIVHGFITLEMLGGFKMPIDLDDSFHWLIDTFLLGLEHTRQAQEQKDQQA